MWFVKQERNRCYPSILSHGNIKRQGIAACLNVKVWAYRNTQISNLRLVGQGCNQVAPFAQQLHHIVCLGLKKQLHSQMAVR